MTTRRNDKDDTIDLLRTQIEGYKDIVSTRDCQLENKDIMIQSLKCKLEIQKAEYEKKLSEQAIVTDDLSSKLEYERKRVSVLSRGTFVPSDGYSSDASKYTKMEDDLNREMFATSL